MLTQGVHALEPDLKMMVLQRVRDYQTFTPDHDPNREHDFGVIEVVGVEKVYWRIDIYEDATMQYGAEDKIRGYRVLTIMLASEH